MAEHIRKCSSCFRYTMEEKCPKCGAKTELARPPKFSLDDKYAHLRREAKREEWERKGWV